MGKLWAIIEVLYQGKSLANKQKWKKTQALITSLGAIIGGIKVLLPPELQAQFGDEAINHIVDSIAIIGIGVVNVYGTYATSDTVGIPNKSK